MKNLKTYKLWLLIIPTVALLALAVLFVPDKGVSVTLQRFSYSGNERMALFVITSQWSRTVRFSAGPFCQAKSNGVWKDQTPSYAYLWGNPVDGRWAFDGTLKPGASATVAVIVPEGAGEWRAAVRSSPLTAKVGRLTFRFRAMMFHLRANWNALREHKALPGFKGEFNAYWPMTNYSHEFFAELDTGR